MHQPAVKLSLAELAKLPFRPPEGAGRLWWGVPHHDLARAMLERLHYYRWLYLDSLAFASGGGQELLLTFSLNPTDEYGLAFGVGSFLAIRVSHSRRKALAAYIGIPEPKHNCVVWLERTQPEPTGKTAEQVADVIVRWFGRKEAGLAKTIERLRRKIVPEPKAMKLLFAAARGHQATRTLPWSRLGQVDKACGGCSGATAWDLLAAVAGAARLNPPLLAPEQVWKFRQMLEKR